MTTEFKETLAAAVEVIAKALNEAIGGRPENWFVWVEDAQAAINAALPILRAQFAEEVATRVGDAAWEEGSKRGPLAGDSEETWMRGVNDGIDFAQTVAWDWGTK